MATPMVEMIVHTEGHLDSDTAERFRQAWEHESAAMSWSGDTPEMFDDLGQGVRSIGLSHIFPKPGPWMTPAVERQLLVEVRWMLMWLEQISGDLGLRFAIRYDDDDLGWIRHGVTDDAIRHGLIAVWERDLQRLERHSP